MNKNDKVIDLKSKAVPVRVREQTEIFKDRRKKRREKINEVKKKFRF